MLRLGPPGFARFLQSPVLAATFGGDEANVAIGLAHFGLEPFGQRQRLERGVVGC